MPDPSQPETLRLHQANERTMLAWVRTGIALMAFGFAIARFGLFLRQLAAVGKGGLPATSAVGSGYLGVILVALGVGTSVAATSRYATVRRAIERNDLGPPSATLVYILGGMAAAMGLVMAILLVRSLAE
jgi:putative membrane protein